MKTSDEIDADLTNLNLSDLEIRFSRSRTYDLATKCNSLATLIHIGIDPLRAIETVGLFTDPQQVTLDSIERIDSILFKNGIGTTEDSYKKRPPETEVFFYAFFKIICLQQKPVRKIPCEVQCRRFQQDR